MRQLFSNTLIYGLGSVASQALAFVLLPLYTRFLTPAEYGTLAIIGSAGMILSILAAIGVHSGLIRTFFDYDTDEERSEVAFTALCFAAAACAVVFAALFALAPRLAPPLLEVPEAVPWLRLAVAIYTLAAVKSVSLAILQIHSRARAYVTCNLSGLVVSLSLTVVLVAFLDRGVGGVLEGQLAGAGVEVGLSVLASVRRLRPALRPAALAPMLSFAIPLVPTNLAAWGLGFADRYFLKEYASYMEVGLYALGFRFGTVIEVLLVAPFSIAWSPYMFSIMKEPGHREVYARTLEYYAFFGGGLALAVSLFAGDVIRLMADPAYFGADSVVFLIALGFLVRGMTYIMVAGIAVRRKTHYSAVVYGCGAVLNLLLLFVLVPRYGTLGAALAVAATYSAITAGLYWTAQRLYAVPYRPLKVVALIGVVTACYVPSRLLPVDAPLVALPAKLGLLALLPVALLAGRFFGRDDLERARRLLAGVLRGEPAPRAESVSAEGGRR